MSKMIDFEALNQAALDKCPNLLERLLPGGKIEGNEYVCADLTGGKGSSCKVNHKTGLWSDFATGESGKDLIALVAAIDGTGQGEAANKLAEMIGYSLQDSIPHTASRQKPKPQVIIPVPLHKSALPPIHYRHGEATEIYKYQGINGKLLGYVCRFTKPELKPNGKYAKQFAPYVFTTSGWQWQGFDKPYPFYGLHRLAELPSDGLIIVVEGESKADALQAILGPNVAVLGLYGGSNKTSYMDYTPLAGKRVVFWPDNDAPGFKAAITFAGKTERSKIIAPPKEAPETWDCADAIAEGWDYARLIEWISLNKLEAKEFEKEYIKPDAQPAAIEQSDSVALTDTQLLEKAKKAKTRLKFISLFQWADVDSYSSREEALEELAKMLAFWSGKNAIQMDRLMRQSALLKESDQITEWDRMQDNGKTYGQQIIERAIERTTKTYSRKRSANAGIDSDKPKIVYAQGELPRLVKELEQSITGFAWQMDKLIVHITRLPASRSFHGLRQPAGLSVITAFDKNSLCLLTSEKAEWVKQKIKDGVVESEYKINPSMDVISCFLAAYGQWTLPQLTGLVTCPIMRPDGSILDKPGYDEITGLYADFNPCSFYPVEENPSKETASEALDFLKDTISEFPFKTDVDRSVALAGLLTAVMRPSVAHAPLIAFSAPTPGTGKSTLADLIGIVATGKPCSAMDYNADTAEFKKAVFATLLEGPPVVLIDNCVGEVNSSLLNMVLSQESIKGRILGLSQNANLPTISLWLATGNNLTIVGDLTRRTLFCTLDAGVEAPAKRQFKRDIYQWAEIHRGELVGAALTILRAFHCADCQQEMEPMNGFNKWSRLIRGALLWLGEADPKDSQLEIEAHDPEREGLRTVFHAWFEHFGNQFVTTKDLLNRNPPYGELEIPDSQQALYQALIDVIPHGRELTSRLLGKWLARYNGRVIDRLKLINTGQKSREAFYWKVIQI